MVSLLHRVTINNYDHVVIFSTIYVKIRYSKN